MIFKKLNRYYLSSYQSLVSIILFLSLGSLHAQVSVNTIEKNDKVTVSTIPGQIADNNVYQVPKVWALSAEQWELARNGESILSFPVVNELINAWLLDKQMKIEIQYPGGEEGEFWVQELTDWLVSLGIPSNNMVVVAGSGAGDMIKFDLIK
jgi:hypothetical protein